MEYQKDSHPTTKTSTPTQNQQTKGHMITRVTGYRTSDGKTFEKLEECQTHEIALILSGLSAEPAPEPDLTSAAEGSPRRRFTQAKAMAVEILKFKDKIVDILTTGPRSKALARSVNGGTKTRPSRARKPQTTETQPQPAAV